MNIIILYLILYTCYSYCFVHVGLDYAEYEDSLSTAVQPIVDAVRHVVVVVTTVVATASCVAVVLSMLGLVAFAYVRAGQIFPVRRVYVVSLAHFCSVNRSTKAHRHVDTSGDATGDAIGDTCHEAKPLASPTSPALQTSSELSCKDEFNFSETKV